VEGVRGVGYREKRRREAYRRREKRGREYFAQYFAIVKI